MPYRSIVVLTLPIYSWQHSRSRHDRYPSLADEEIEVQRLSQNHRARWRHSWVWTHPSCSGCSSHHARGPPWTGGIESQKYVRLFRAHLVQEFPHRWLENQVGVINNTNPRPHPRWLWFSASRVGPGNLHFGKLPRGQVLEKPLV